jgi:hypothetical protein
MEIALNLLWFASDEKPDARIGAGEQHLLILCCAMVAAL